MSSFKTNRWYIVDSIIKNVTALAKDSQDYSVACS